MARRSYPFYSSVGFRTANKVRNGVAGWFYSKILYVYTLFIWWIVVFIGMKVVEMVAVQYSRSPENDSGTIVNPGDFITFSGYVKGTWENILYPVLNFIGQAFTYVLS